MQYLNFSHTNAYLILTFSNIHVINSWESFTNIIQKYSFIVK